MELLLASFLAGILTILAPCVLPLLPIIIGWSVQEKWIKRPFLITSSLALSIVFFTLILKVSTILIDIDPLFWKLVSWWLIIIIWIFTLLPDLWKQISLYFSLTHSSQTFLETKWKERWVLGAILTWAALWPVFSSCSPTFALILAIVLPASFYVWILNLLLYSLGLSLMMLLIAYFGQKIIIRLKWISNPNSMFKKWLWILFIIVWISIIIWFDKKIEWLIINTGFTEITSILEQDILNRIKE